VVPQLPDPDCESFVPYQPKQKHRYQEIVVFDSARCLPRFLVELQPSLPKTIMPKMESKGDSKAENKGEASAKPVYSHAASLAAFGSKAVRQASASSGAGIVEVLGDADPVASLALG